MDSLHAVSSPALAEILQARINVIMAFKRQPGYENLFFSGSYAEHPPLRLTFEPPLVASQLVFSLQGEGPLSLGGIEILTQDGASEACLAFAEDDPDAYVFPRNAATSPIPMTTPERLPPVISINFANPTAVAGITVANRERELWRNHSLRIVCKDAAQNERLLFSHQELVDACLDMLIRSREEYAHDKKLWAAAKKLDTILLTLMYDACPKTMADLSIKDIALLSLIKDSVSRNFFYPRQREITPHGIVRSFRFWSKQEWKEYLEDAAELIEKLEIVSPHVCFAFGSVLGFVREKECFIPHDDDHDIMVFYPQSMFVDADDAFTYTEEHLRSQGMKLLGRRNFVTKVAGTKSQKEMDVFAALYDEEGCIFVHPYFRKNYLHTDMIFPLAKAMIWGVKCNVPHNIIEYLTATYGRHWRTPLNSSFTSEHNRIHVEK